MKTNKNFILYDEFQLMLEMKVNYFFVYTSFQSSKTSWLVKTKIKGLVCTVNIFYNYFFRTERFSNGKRIES